ncbi:MAG: hypothetical protein LC799_10060, partial [Actinobacteria bacterium]|nr:hypothetical protein [Actinomycetota bacterium]
SPKSIRVAKAKVLAARQSTSVSKLVAHQIQKLVGEDDAYSGPGRWPSPTSAEGSTSVAAPFLMGMTCMTGEPISVDTSVLVYAYDADAGAKHRTAQARRRTLWENESGLMSTQVLQELYVTVTRKVGRPTV